MPALRLAIFINSEPMPKRRWVGNILFYRMQKYIKLAIKRGPNKLKYCGNICCGLAKSLSTKLTKINCYHCGKEKFFTPSKLADSKYGNHFCSKNCSAKYHNTHKTTGTNRSKLEKWLEIQISLNFPTLKVIYNNIDVIMKKQLAIFNNDKIISKKVRITMETTIEKLFI